MPVTWEWGGWFARVEDGMTPDRQSPFDRALGKTLGIEGGFSDHPSDRGGATMQGITEKLARKYGYAGPMDRLPPSFGRSIYKQEFWDPLRLDEVAAMSFDVASEMFDTAVHCGPGTVARFFQRALRLFNRRGKLYPDIAVDGAIGPKTLNAMAAYINARGFEGETVLLRVLNGLQVVRYVMISEADEEQEEFIYGWIRTRVA